MPEVSPNIAPGVDLKTASLSTSFSGDVHYLAITSAYGERTTTRSRVPLINHIREGLYVLDSIGADLATKQAYCLHPMFQGDAELGLVSPELVERFNRWALVLVVEYRNIANAYLSTRVISSIENIALSPLPQVQAMLIADKVQNRKDFDAYHKGTHPRSKELDQYFQNWFMRLGVSDEFYNRMVRELNEDKHLTM
jgi:hypothetical protein